MIAIIHRKSENAIGYKTVSAAEGYVDGSGRQRKKEAKEKHSPWPLSFCPPERL